MRAWEFLTESTIALDQAHDGLDVASAALPHTYVIPELKNSDFYELYRFGIAISAVRGEGGQDDGVQNKYEPEFEANSSWGEHQVVSSFDPNIGKVIDQALSKINLKGKKMVSTPGSDELKDTTTLSPMKPFKGYKK